MTDIELYAELVDKKLQNEAPPFDFEGNNCYDIDNVCIGWDGISKRCHCGNRRVTWTLSYCKTYVYGEAY